jgi:hypothetical protein
MADINGIPYVESGDLVSAYPTVSQDLAQEVSDQLASKLPYSYGTATPSTSVDGFLWYDENDTPPTPKFWDGAAFQALTSGKVLQVINAYTGTNAQSNSSTFADTGLTATITPSKTTSKVLIIVNQVEISKDTGNTGIGLRLMRDATNILNFAYIAGFTNNTSRNDIGSIGAAYLDSPASTSAITYKTQFNSQANTNAVYVQRGGTSASTITLMEIAA